MELLTQIAEYLAYTQNHGGLMVLCVYGVMLGRLKVQEIQFRIQNVETAALERTAKHELIYHNEDRRKPKGEHHGN